MANTQFDNPATRQRARIRAAAAAHRDALQKKIEAALSPEEVAKVLPLLEGFEDDAELAADRAVLAGAARLDFGEGPPPTMNARDLLKQANAYLTAASSILERSADKHD